MTSKVGSFLPQPIKNVLKKPLMSFMKNRQRVQRMIDTLHNRGFSGLFLVEQSTNAFATHVPILIGLAYILSPERVLEFGSGQYSTSIFLDKNVFADLKCLLSYENDKAWYDKINKSLDSDSRLELNYIDSPMYTAIEMIDLRNYGLIFVDDSFEIPLRAKTLQAITSYAEGISGAVVIHDFEWKVYRKITARFSNSFRFTALNPNTGVVWNGSLFDKQSLAELNLLIQKHHDHISPEDVQGWLRVLNNSGSLKTNA